jgi:hypothetical protein
MSKTRIFISSTCYDLAAVREGLREHILKIGHEPLLSEYPSFPVNPDDTAIANCKKNVQKNTDVLILIIGGRRGALDPKSGKSVTNSEYENARRCGIPCFVFINRSVNTLLPVWKKNPTADFSPAVDFPDVFRFIERIREENNWTFTFEKVAEIEECLTVQLSAMFRELLERSRTGKLDAIASYASESEEAKRLAREKPEYWEFLLTAELLRSKLREVRKRFDRQKSGLVHIPSYRIKGIEFGDWVQLKINDLTSLTQAMRGQLPVIREAWGPPGQLGDVFEIKRSVEDLIKLCNDLVDWEEDLIAAFPPEEARGVKDSMKGWTQGILDKMETLPVELSRPFEGGAKPKGVLEITLVLDAPPTERFYAELQALTVKNPLRWLV